MAKPLVQQRQQAPTPALAGKWTTSVGQEHEPGTWDATTQASICLLTAVLVGSMQETPCVPQRSAFSRQANGSYDRPLGINYTCNSTSWPAATFTTKAPGCSDFRHHMHSITHQGLWCAPACIPVGRCTPSPLPRLPALAITKSTTGTTKFTTDDVTRPPYSDTMAKPRPV